MKSSSTSKSPIPVIGEITTKTVLTVIAWGFVFAVALYYVFPDMLVFYSFDQVSYGPHWDHAGWLFIHVAGGMLALFVGFIQFWTGLRRTQMRIHRWCGRIYLGSVAVSSIGAVYIIAFENHSVFGFQIGAAGFALAWISTTSLAYIAILRRRIVQHKEWMIRSYVVLFGFAFFRVLLNSMIALEIATPAEISSAAAWMCWAIPLLITELILQGNKIFREQKVHVPA